MLAVYRCFLCLIMLDQFDPSSEKKSSRCNTAATHCRFWLNNLNNTVMKYSLMKVMIHEGRHEGFSGHVYLVYLCTLVCNEAPI